MKMCPKCGKITNEDVCPACGTIVNAVGAQPAQETPSQKPSNTEPSAGTYIDASPVSNGGQTIDASPVNNGEQRTGASPAAGIPKIGNGAAARGKDVWSGGFKMSRKLLGIIIAAAAVLILVIAVNGNRNEITFDESDVVMPEFEDTELPEIEPIETPEAEGISLDGNFSGINLGSGTNVDPETIINEKEAATIRNFYEMCEEKGLTGNVMDVSNEDKAVYMVDMDGVEHVILFSPNNFGKTNAACVLTESGTLSDAENELYNDLCSAMYASYGVKDFTDRTEAKALFLEMSGEARGNISEEGEGFALRESTITGKQYLVYISPEGIEGTYVTY